MRLAARAGGLWNTSARTVCNAHAVLDVSGGDSFAELYGPDRFRTVTLPKRISLDAGRRLILLPQTYGPFRTAKATAIARNIVRHASAAWARDEASFAQLKSLLGNDYDPKRHHSGVDMAFGLPSTRPSKLLTASVADWLREYPRIRPVLGVNISGLLYNNRTAAISSFDLRDDYRTAILGVLRMLLQSTNARVVLVPHVIAAGGTNSECDLAACRSVMTELHHYDERVGVLEGSYDAAELKWIIGQTDWFCGTRMHATIAALSSGVPTMALAYSMKTQGVFETCGQAEEVADLRRCDSSELSDRVATSWCERAKTRLSLERALPRVLSRAEQQMDAIAAAIGRPSI